MRVLIVGGVAGGASAAARLRRLDENATIVMFEKDEHISFANCGLPYHIGGVIPKRASLLLQTPESFRQRFNVDVRVYTEVTGIDRAAKRVSFTNLVTGQHYTEGYDYLVLAPGSVPALPPIPGLSLDVEGVFAVRNVGDADEILERVQSGAVRRAVVLGGGFIGAEMAENLHAAGVAVTLLERAAQLLPQLDYEMACDVHRYVKQKGIDLHLNTSVTAVSKHADGLHIEADGETLVADMLITATGVRPNSALAQAAGIAANERGGILTDAHMRTSDESIFAVGDAAVVTDFITGAPALIPLAGPANKQGRIAADNICGIPSAYGGTQGSSIVKLFDMAAAATGLREESAKKFGLDYDKVYAWMPGHAGYYPGSKPMSMKVLFEKGAGKILGAQIVGFDGVDKRCDLLAMAIRSGLTAFDLTKLELCYAPPFGSAKDPVNMAGYMMENVLMGKVKSFHWHDVDSLPRDGSVTLLDVRPSAEVANGHIEGFTHIPVDSLRERIRELPTGLPVYVHCHSGLRSYIAARMLMQKGFAVYNLSGGYRLYASATGK